MAGLNKKLLQFQQKGKSEKEIKDLQVQIEKIQAENSAEQDPFQFDDAVPLTRMQTEAEFAQKSARAKALELALQSASGDQPPEEEVPKVYGLQAAKIAKADSLGLSLEDAKKPKKQADKSLRDIFKIGAHVLK